MTPKRLILAAITLIVVFLVGQSLLTSLNQPQITDRLQLYQTDLVLRASELQITDDDENLGQAKQALLGQEPFENALDEYQQVQKTANANLNKLQAQLEDTKQKVSPPSAVFANPPIVSPQEQQLQANVLKQQELLNQVSVRIGLLQVKQNQVDQAIATWNSIIESPASPTASPSRAAKSQPAVTTARVLLGLWSDPPQLLPNAEEQLQKHLNGWFRDQALMRLYDLQQRSGALTALQASTQEAAENTLVKLSLAGVAPLVGCIIGIGLLIFLGNQWLSQGKQATLAIADDETWETPWNWEIIWQVLIVGFFFIGQIALPIVLQVLGLSFAAASSRARAAYALTYYVLMASASLLVMYLSIRQYLPLPEGWFRFLKAKKNWLTWGIAGYFVALPLMLLISFLNQKLWQGQGGSNPLLQIVLEEGDPIALAMFFFTAAVAAPLFEETLFRGFLLPSLTRYMPVWGAILLSSFIFATAHLSLSEVIPLALLGSVLGFVYVRSRSLLSSMLLHSLWNSATMLGLLILGSGTK